MKKTVSFISAMALVLSSIGGIQAFAADTSERGTVTVTVIDSETNKLFRKDMDFSIVGGSLSGSGAGMGGAIYLGGFNTSECNPYVHSDILTDFSYSVNYVGKSCNGYSYNIDMEKSDVSFDFTESNNQNVVIYMEKYWFAEPVEYSFDEILNMDEESYKQFCWTNELEYHTPEDMQKYLDMGVIDCVMLTPDKYLNEGLEDIFSSEDIRDIVRENEADYDFSGVMEDIGLPEEYYDYRVNRNGFMVINRADSITESGDLIFTFNKLTEVFVEVKDEYKNTDEYIRLNQMKRALPMLCDSFDSFRFNAPSGPNSTAPPVKGDANGDWELTIADAVTLQNWLMGKSNASIADIKAVDLCVDGQLDVFDYIKLKEMIVEICGKLITVDDILALSLKDSEEITWADFKGYYGEDTGSGIYVMKYPIAEREGMYLLVGGSSMEGKPDYVRLFREEREEVVDIFSEEFRTAMEDFFAAWNGPENDETNRAAAKKIGEYALAELKSGRYTIDTEIDNTSEIANEEITALFDKDVFGFMYFVDEHTVHISLNKGLLDAYGYLVTDGTVSYAEGDYVEIPDSGYDGEQVYIDWAGDNLYYFSAGT